MATNIAHITETAMLLLAAYLLGCILGYAVRRILHAARGTRSVVVLPIAVANATVTSVPERPRSAAIRLAASVDDLHMPPPALPSAHPVVAPLPKPVVAKPTVERPVVVTADVKRMRKPKAGDPKPAALTSPRPDGADNLKQIKGIGPKIEASLYGMGVFHIDQIAGWSTANIDWVDKQLAFKGRIRRERWVEQAAELSRARKTA